MITVTLDELAVNAITAALDERANRLTARLASLSEQPKSSSRDFAMDTVRLAIGQTLRARIEIASALDEPDYPGDMTFATWTETEQRAAWGNR